MLKIDPPYRFGVSRGVEPLWAGDTKGGVPLGNACDRLARGKEGVSLGSYVFHIKVGWVIGRITSIWPSRE